MQQIDLCCKYCGCTLAPIRTDWGVYRCELCGVLYQLVYGPHPEKRPLRIVKGQFPQKWLHCDHFNCTEPGINTIGDRLRCWYHSWLLVGEVLCPGHVPSRPDRCRGFLQPKGMGWGLYRCTECETVYHLVVPDQYHGGTYAFLR